MRNPMITFVLDDTDYRMIVDDLAHRWTIRESALNPADRAIADAERLSIDASRTPARAFDVTGAIIAFEQGELDEEDTVQLFQHLIDTGLAWQLQGSYGRAAAHLIEQGICTAA